VAETAPLRVQLIAKTEFLAPPDVPWSTDAEGGPALVEFAGRACYQSWSKPNPRTATNVDYLRHIIDVGHFSVLDLAVVHPRADPPPPLLLFAAVPEVRA
jgi:thymidylate synthase (FAD)